MIIGKSNIKSTPSVIYVADISLFCEAIISDNNFLKYPSKEINQRNDDIPEPHETINENSHKVIITIPAFNEEETVGNVIEKVHKAMKNSNYSYNYLILVVNDGSSDKTINVAENTGAHVFSHCKNNGLAETFRTEMKICLKLGADIIVHTDADGQYNAEEIPNLIEHVEKGYDLVLGSRFKGAIERMTIMKRFGNRAFSLLISLIAKRRISDGQTGFRAFTRKVAEEITIESSYTYTQEQIIKACKMDYKIIEIPTSFAKRDDNTSRLMKNPLDYAIRAWKDIIKLYFFK